MARWPRAWAVGLAGLVCLIVAWLAVLFLPVGRQGLVFKPVSFAELDGWAGDDLTGFHLALTRSCAAIKKMPASRALPGSPMAGEAGDWAIVCDALEGLEGLALKSAIEAWFIPHAVTLSGRSRGTFTGYYEPILDGSLTEDSTYSVPLYPRPDNLIEVDLGQFRSDLAGRRVAGQIKGTRLVPYADRADITGGALSGQVDPLLWVDDPVSAFFLHIQGSGRVRLQDGTLKSVGYAGQNGHPYFAIGRLLIREGHASREEMSLQFIRQWLQDHPEEQARVLNANPSYIFFRDLGAVDGPYGSAGVVLTPKRSLAVDRKHLAMHVPVFVVTERPDTENPKTQSVPFRRLLMAQDTGGAITGEIRGDVFWGPGAEAEVIAGHMADSGRYYVLLPKPVVVGMSGRAS